MKTDSISYKLTTNLINKYCDIFGYSMDLSFVIMFIHNEIESKLDDLAQA